LHARVCSVGASLWTIVWDVVVRRLVQLPTVVR
jgi:hypothetical protein